MIRARNPFFAASAQQFLIGLIVDLLGCPSGVVGRDFDDAAAALDLSLARSALSYVAGVAAAEYQSELVAGKVVRSSMRSRGLGESGRKSLKHVVAASVTQRVVDPLEVVEVDRDDRAARASGNLREFVGNVRRKDTFEN